MTITQLIEILSRYDHNMPVVVSDEGGVFEASALDVQVVRMPGNVGGCAICISAHETASALQVRPEVRCPACGWVHFSIPLHHAEQAVNDENADSRREGREAVASLNKYLRCFRCGRLSDGFLPAQESDAPAGCTIQPVVVRCP